MTLLEVNLDFYDSLTYHSPNPCRDLQGLRSLVDVIPSSVRELPTHSHVVLADRSFGVLVKSAKSHKDNVLSL